MDFEYLHHGYSGVTTAISTHSTILDPEIPINFNDHILLHVINVNTTFVYVEALNHKTQYSVLNALENISEH